MKENILLILLNFFQKLMNHLSKLTILKINESRESIAWILYVIHTYIKSFGITRAYTLSVWLFKMHNYDFFFRGNA